MRAAIYARFSSDRQREESIEDQVKACRSYALEHGYEITDVYSDSAKTGRTDRRPGFKKAIAESNEYDVLLVYKLDRFSRDRLDSLIYRRELERNGAKLVSVTEQIPDTPEGILLDGLLSAMAEHYSANLSVLTLRGMYGNAERCHWNGVPCYGYRPDDEGHYQIYEPEAVHVRALYSLAAANNPIGTLKEYCKQHDIRSTTGRPADSNMIYKMLSNRKYLGEYRWGETVIKGGMPRIIETDVFEAVQNRPRISGKKNRADYYLVGRAYCDKGCKMTGEKAKENYYYYTCEHRRIRKELLEQTIASAMRETVNDDVLEAVVDKMMKDEREKNGFDLKKASLRETEKALTSIRSAIEKGFDAASMLDRYNELVRKKERLEAEIMKSSEIPTKKELMEAAKCFMEIGDDRDLVTLFLDKVIVSDDVLGISFRICNSAGGNGRRKTPTNGGVLSEDLLAPSQTSYSKFSISVTKIIY